MKQTEIIIPEQYLSTININGLSGRMLSVPVKKKSKNRKTPEILLVYGHHSSIERMYSLAVNLSKHGNVTMPDLPGFGGMDSFYRIGQEPNFDNMADYLATFIKMHYKNRRFIICGMSYGFLVTTRTMQKYPELSKKVDILASLVGFSHYEDFKFSPQMYNNMLLASRLGKARLTSLFVRYALLNRFIIKLAYTINSGHAKLKDASQEQRKSRIKFEVFLWHCNDVRTYFYTFEKMLKVNMTNETVDKTLHHVTVTNDQYFDEETVTNNLNKIYSKVVSYRVQMPNHAPTVISDEKEAGKMIPHGLIAELRKIR